MIHNVFKALIHDYTDIRVSEKLHQVQASQPDYVFPDSSGLYYGRPYFVLL